MSSWCPSIELDLEKVAAGSKIEALDRSYKDMVRSRDYRLSILWVGISMVQKKYVGAKEKRIQKFFMLFSYAWQAQAQDPTGPY
jgi:hypothetical protein